MLDPVVRPIGSVHAGRMPDPEVLERPKRRRFSAEYKLSILREADAVTEDGQIAAILRRERLYSSHLVDWRRARDRGALAALARPSGRPRPHPLAKENERLRRENVRLSTRLTAAERIIEIQSRLSALLGIPLAQGGGDERTGS
jgi:transposase-like protein